MEPFFTTYVDPSWDDPWILATFSSPPKKNKTKNTQQLRPNLWFLHAKKMGRRKKGLSFQMAAPLGVAWPGWPHRWVLLRWRILPCNAWRLAMLWQPWEPPTSRCQPGCHQIWPKCFYRKKNSGGKLNYFLWQGISVFHIVSINMYFYDIDVLIQYVTVL